MTKLTVTFHETEAGHVEAQIHMQGQPPIYKREADYANALKDLVRSEIPKLCKQFGGAGVLEGDTQQQKGN